MIRPHGQGGWASADIQCGHFSDKGVIQMRTSVFSGAKNLCIFRHLWCVRKDKEGGVEPVRTFCGQRGGWCQFFAILCGHFEKNDFIIFIPVSILSLAKLSLALFLSKTLIALLRYTQSLLKLILFFLISCSDILPVETRITFFPRGSVDIISGTPLRIALMW